MATITTQQAPSAKPVNVVEFVTSTFKDLITVDDYQVPIVGFGGSTELQPGAAEITSPLVLSNVTTTAVKITAQIESDGVAYPLANEIIVEPNDIVYIPLNGQFLLSETNDKLQIKANVSAASTAFVSYTQGEAEQDTP